jgi:hypothetical protein
MWHTYARGNGVAIVSSYGTLKSILDALPAEDKANLGLVRYGNRHLAEYPRRNLMVNISTKREKYADEREVRAMLWLPDPTDGCNRHIDLNNRFHHRPIYPTKNPSGVWRTLDIQQLIAEVIVSPFAEPHFFSEVEQAIRDGGSSVKARPSAMTSAARFLPTADELRRLL